MIGYGVAATCFAGLGITLVVRRESGILKRIRATPLPAVDLPARGARLDVRRLPDRGGADHRARPRCSSRSPFPERLLSLLVVLLLGAAAFAAMGLGITALVRSAEGSSAVINAVYLPMAIISGHVLLAQRRTRSSCA